MSIKLVALDLDGTILNSEGQLSRKTRQTLWEIKKRGIHLILATGRRLVRTLPWVRALQLQEPVVVHNGAVIYDPNLGQNLFAEGIELPVARRVLAQLEARQINYAVYTGESAGEKLLAPAFAWQEKENLLLKYMGEMGERVGTLSLQKPPIRISVIDDASQVEPFHAYLKAEFATEVKTMFFSTAKNWRGIEIICAGCSKGAGVAFIAGQLGLKAGQVVAVGDNVNDLEMLAWAGTGVAMGNSPLLLKEISDFIAAGNDEDGAALILEELLL